MGFFTAASLLGAPRWLWMVIGLALALAVGLVVMQRMEEADDRRNQELGATVEREGALTETLERTEKGNEARQEIEQELRTGDGRSRAVYDQCLRTARTPANCERFLPERSETER